MSLNGKYNAIFPIHIKSYVLHAKTHVSLPSYYGSSCQRMTPVVPHGLPPATQEHYLQSYALSIQPRELPEPNGVNSVQSQVMRMMTMISSTINRPSIIATQLMKVMTPFLIFCTTIMTSMTTCHQISLAKKMNKPIPHLKGKALLHLKGKALPHLKGKVDLMKKLILHLKGTLDLMKKLIPHLKVQMDQALEPVDPLDLLTPILALPFLQMMKQHSALPHSFPRTRPILSNLSL
jgi:hypothetical protein